MTNTELILKDLKWLESQKTSNDIVKISQVLNHLAILTVRLGEEVSVAYQLMNEREDGYKGSFADFIASSTLSVAKAEVQAEAELIEKKKEWTTAKNNYKRVSTFLDRCDKVLEAFRQSVSVIKAVDLKNV